MEVGILPLFRGFVLFEMLLLLARAALDAGNVALPIAPSPWPGVAVLALFFGYLSWPRARQSFGRSFLPLALGIATFMPLAGSALAMKLRLAAGGDGLDAGSWWLIPLLLVPVIFAAWQYGFRVAALLCFAAVATDVALRLTLAAGEARVIRDFAAAAAVRCLIFLPVAYVVARLVREQRRQRAALAEANARLAVHTELLERNRLARELHDTLAHGLSGIAVQLEAMSTLWDADRAAARVMLTTVLESTRFALRESRRAIVALRASPLDRAGLAGALRELAGRVAAERGFNLEVDLPEEVLGLAPDTEQAIYRIAAESIANSAQHAGARHLALRVADTMTAFCLCVEDDGRGFDCAAPPDTRHLGLRGMQERARAIGASLVIESRHGSGTVVRLMIPRPQ